MNNKVKNERVIFMRGKEIKKSKRKNYKIWQYETYYILTDFNNNFIKNFWDYNDIKSYVK